MTARILLAALLLFVASACLASLIWWDRIAPYLSTRPTGREASGADPEYRDELRAMRDIPVAPELISDGEMDLAWGLIWHDFEHAMQKEIDRVFAPYLAALRVADDFDELREQTCPKELMPA